MWLAVVVAVDVANVVVLLVSAAADRLLAMAVAAACAQQQTHATKSPTGPN